MATYSSILAWEIPWTEEPGSLQSMSSQRVRYNWGTEHSWVTMHAHSLLSRSQTTYPPKGQHAGKRGTNWGLGRPLGPKGVGGAGGKGVVLPSSCLKELWLFVRRTRPPLSNTGRISSRPTQTKQKLEKGAELVRNRLESGSGGENGRNVNRISRSCHSQKAGMFWLFLSQIALGLCYEQLLVQPFEVGRLPCGSDNKESACSAGGSGREDSPGEGNGYPLQCSCLENPTGRGAW